METDQGVQVGREWRGVEVLITACIKGPEEADKIGAVVGGAPGSTVDEAPYRARRVRMHGLLERLLFHRVRLSRVVDRIPNLETDWADAVAFMQRVAQGSGDDDTHHCKPSDVSGS